jgi:predicted nucleic acid-binding protein
VSTIVLDSSALLAFLENQAGASRIANLLSLALQGEREVLMSVVNWGEVCYASSRAKGADVARRTEAQVAQLPVTIVDADRPLTRVAAEFHVRYKLPYVDCFAAALASRHKAPVATCDRDFSRIVSEIPLIWI